MGGPRFPRAKREFGEMGRFSQEPQEEDLDAVPRPIDDEEDRKPSPNKRDLSGETIVADEVIDLESEDATDRLTRLQESLPPGTVTDPNDPDVIPNDAEVTDEDEAELTKALERSSQITETSMRMSFEDSPELWGDDRLKEDLGELLGLHRVGVGETELRNIMEKQADEYDTLFKRLSHDDATGMTAHPEATGDKFSREAYLKKLQDGFHLHQALNDTRTGIGDETKEIELPEEAADITEETPL